MCGVGGGGGEGGGEGGSEGVEEVGATARREGDGRGGDLRDQQGNKFQRKRRDLELHVVC